MIIVPSAKSLPNTLLALIVAGFLSVSTAASAEIFVDIPGIPGGSVSAQYADQIEAIGATGNFSAAGCGVFTITKNIDESSPRLIAYVVTKRAVPDVEISYTAPTSTGPLEYFQMALKDVRIARLKSSTSENPGDRPVEQVNLRAGSVDITYTPQDATGAPGSAITETIQCQGSKQP